SRHGRRRLVLIQARTSSRNARCSTESWRSMAVVCRAVPAAVSTVDRRGTGPIRGAYGLARHPATRTGPPVSFASFTAARDASRRCRSAACDGHAGCTRTVARRTTKRRGDMMETTTTATTAEANGALIRGAYDAFARGDVQGALAAFAEDILWHVPGRGPL